MVFILIKKGLFLKQSYHISEILFQVVYLGLGQIFALL